MKNVVAVFVCVAVVGAAACGGGSDPAGDRRAIAALEPLADNQLPFGHVDTPPASAVVPPTFPVGGWAMDDEGIEAIRIYVDGKFKASSRLTVDRADVSKAFATYAHQTDRHGFNATVTIGAPGTHKLLVQAVDVKGATRDIGQVDIVVQQ
jgi:hypothetical protein